MTGATDAQFYSPVCDNWHPLCACGLRTGADEGHAWAERVHGI